jgi:hypothetical protein
MEESFGGHAFSFIGSTAHIGSKAFDRSTHGRYVALITGTIENIGPLIPSSSPVLGLFFVPLPQ